MAPLLMRAFCVFLLAVPALGFLVRPFGPFVSQGVRSKLYGSADDEAVRQMQADIDAIMAATSPAASASPPAPAAIPEPLWAESKSVKRGIAVASSLLAAAFFFVQHNSADTTGVALLRKMEAESVQLPTALCSGKPTLVEFFAPWCESCKESAPGVRALELQYRDRVNFVAIDGSDISNANLVSLFRVDGIPHFAFIDADTTVQTSLVGAVPKQIVREELEALMSKQPLPYEGFDAFATSTEGSTLVSGVDKQKLCAAELKRSAL